MDTRVITVFFLAFAFCWAGLRAQNYVPGQSYFGANNYIEYIAGNLPIILSAPHGGALVPSVIPDRNCSGCSYAKDLNTQELIRALSESLHERTGCYPHVIINLLHRKKLDANRDIIEAADSNALAEQAWYDFHQFIESSEDSVALHFNKGLYIDLHGHGHSIQRLELGYLLYKSELALSDSVLAAPFYNNVSSIKRLGDSNLQNLSFPELLRGTQSFGALIADRGYPAVPSPTDPFPDADEDYFNGGYNTFRYCSSEQNVLSGFQIESNYTGVRDNTANLNKFADSLAVSIIEYLQRHYFSTNPQTWCGGTVAMEEVSEAQERIDFSLSPNPGNARVWLRFEHEDKQGWTTDIYNLQGEKIRKEDLFPGDVREILLSEKGSLLFVLRHNGQIISQRMLLRM